MNLERVQQLMDTLVEDDYRYNRDRFLALLREHSSDIKQISDAGNSHVLMSTQIFEKLRLFTEQEYDDKELGQAVMNRILADLVG